MKKSIFTAAILLLSYCGYAQEVPKEIMRVLENHVKDPDAHYGLSRAKKRG